LHSAIAAPQPQPREGEYDGFEYTALPPTAPFSADESARCPVVRQWLYRIATPTRYPEFQHNPQRCVNAAHLFKTQITDALAEPTRIDRCGLFGQHPRDAATDLDLRPKARSAG
jgi:hypothetical protein